MGLELAGDPGDHCNRQLRSGPNCYPWTFGIKYLLHLQNSVQRGGIGDRL